MSYSAEAIQYADLISGALDTGAHGVKAVQVIHENQGQMTDKLCP